MMTSIFPDTNEEILELGLEDLALLILRYLGAVENTITDRLNLNNFIISLSERWADQEDVLRAFTEGWTWLERELMLAPRGRNREFFFITRRGRSLLAAPDSEAYQRGTLLREVVLDPVLASKVRPAYLRGDYEAAMLLAFKEVEVRVRRASRLGNDAYGTRLMRAAFNVETGPLKDDSREPSERQAMSDLFSGVIGLLKNPSSHRDIDLEDPQETAEAIMWANYLLRLVDRLSPSGD